MNAANHQDISLLRRAIAGEDLQLDLFNHSLHQLTQVAAALRPDAGLTIRNTKLMSPIERASIASASTGRVVFL